VIAKTADFVFRLACMLIGFAIGLVLAHAVMPSATTEASVFDFLFSGAVGFCCGWLSKSDG
jgi:hypothetical protein